MKQSIYFLDAFTSEIFKGNPAAVCPLDNWLSETQMQKIAAENNLAETAFLVKKLDHYELRWFTPTVEVDLCGHATLASAYVIFNNLNYSGSQIRFETKSGSLFVNRNKERLTLDFPGRVVESCNPTKELLANFSNPPKEVLKSGTGTYIILLDNENDVTGFKPDFAKLALVDRCVNITAPGSNCDFVSRFFGPNIGLPEDSVTGSAHCGLAIYWSKKLARTDELHAVQLSARTGEIFCQVVNDRVLLSGYVAPYLEGHINI
ncbi:MAG: PhzF family phenazine biosynthesis protein [Bdellovibrionota bacterium]